MVEFQRFPLFSVLFEGITVPNCSCESPKSVYSLWTNPPNTSCSDHYSPVICQLLVLALWHHGSVAPCLCALFPWSGSFQLPGSCNISSPTTHASHEWFTVRLVVLGDLQSKPLGRVISKYLVIEIRARASVAVCFGLTAGHECFIDCGCWVHLFVSQSRG